MGLISDDSEKAKAQQEAFLDKYKDHFDPDDLSEARSLWRQSRALDKVQTTISKPSVIGPTPIKLRATGAPDDGYINGKGLAKSLRTLNQNGVLKQAGLSDSHIQSLQDLSGLLGRSNKIPRIHPLVNALMVGLHVGTAGTDYAASQVLSKIMTNEPATNALVKGLKSGATTGAISKGIKAALAPADDQSDQSPLSGSSPQKSPMTSEDSGNL